MQHPAVKFETMFKIRWNWNFYCHNGLSDISSHKQAVLFLFISTFCQTFYEMKSVTKTEITDVNLQ